MHDPGRDADDSCSRRNILYHHSIRANYYSISDRDAPQHACAGTDEYIIANNREGMLITHSNGNCSYQTAVLSNPGGANYHAHRVRDVQSSAVMWPDCNIHPIKSIQHPHHQTGNEPNPVLAAPRPEPEPEHGAEGLVTQQQTERPANGYQSRWSDGAWNDPAPHILLKIVKHQEKCTSTATYYSSFGKLQRLECCKKCFPAIKLVGNSLIIADIKQGA